MTIAVHINAGKHETLTDSFNFICFSEMAAAMPDNHFIFIFDTPPHPELYLESNCTPVILLPTLKNNLVRHYWYNYKLPVVIDKYNADVFITSGPNCSFRLQIPQYTIVSKKDISLTEKSIYLKKFFPAFLKKLHHLFTTEQDAFELLQNRYGLSGNVSLLFPGFRKSGSPLTFEEREVTKDSFTQGNEYFLYQVIDQDFEKLRIVLKAFSIFKKWQKSSMRMILQLQSDLSPNIIKELGLYKYRDDIIQSQAGEDSDQLVKSAYAILVDNSDIFQVALPAMSSGVPVILKENNNNKILQGVIRISWTEKNISEQMMRLYKDEHFRRAAIDESVAYSTKYSWKLTAEKIWQTVRNLSNS